MTHAEFVRHSRFEWSEGIRGITLRIEAFKHGYLRPGGASEKWAADATERATVEMQRQKSVYEQLLDAYPAAA